MPCVKCRTLNCVSNRQPSTNTSITWLLRHLPIWIPPWLPKRTITTNPSCWPPIARTAHVVANETLKTRLGAHPTATIRITISTLYSIRTIGSRIWGRQDHPLPSRLAAVNLKPRFRRDGQVRNTIDITGLKSRSSKRWTRLCPTKAVASSWSKIRPIMS